MRRAIRTLGEYAVAIAPWVALYFVLVAVGVYPLLATAGALVLMLADYWTGARVETFLTEHGPLPAEAEESGSA